MPVPLFARLTASFSPWLAAAVALGGTSSALAQDLPIINGLTLRLAADFGVTADVSGRISAWADQSGAGHSAAQPTASSQPTLVANALNGLPVVRFGTGGNHFLSLASQVITSQQFTIVVVTRDVSTGYNYRELISNWDASYGGASVFFGTMAQNPVRARLTDDFGGAGTGQTGVGTITNASAFFIFTGVSGTNAVAVYQNTAAIASRATPITTRTLTGLYVIGRQGTGTFDEYWRGDIAEMLVYNRELSAGELSQVWQFLLSKYLPALLPLRITAIARLDDGNFRLTGTGQPALTYTVLGNDDLTTTNWLSLGPASADAMGDLFFTDTQATNYARRFYRFSLP